MQHRISKRDIEKPQRQFVVNERIRTVSHVDSCRLTNMEFNRESATAHGRYLIFFSVKISK